MIVSADGVFARLDELQLQKAIRLSELPLAGKIKGVYQSIGRKSEAPKASSSKRARPCGDEGSSGRQKKVKISFENLDMEKDLSTWKKEELEVYLSHHHIKKTGNKPELIRRVTDHVQAAAVEQQWLHVHIVMCTTVNATIPHARTNIHDLGTYMCSMHINTLVWVRGHKDRHCSIML